MPRKKQQKKGEVLNYGIDIEDEVPDMNLGDLFDQPVSPQQEKQLVPKLPTYEESVKDLLEGNKDFYINPKYFSQKPQELPPKYDDDDDNNEVDYSLDNEYMDNKILNDMKLENYDSVEKVLNQPEMTDQKRKSYLKNIIIKRAKEKRFKLPGYKSHVTKQYKSGKISDAERQYEKKYIRQQTL